MLQKNRHPRTAFESPKEAGKAGKREREVPTISKIGYAERGEETKYRIEMIQKTLAETRKELLRK